MMMGIFLIPTTKVDKWQIEKYSKIRSNEFSFSDDGLRVKVDQSASPFIYPIEKPIKVLGFKIQGEYFGLPKFNDLSKQGSKGFDDSVLRIGFIVPGEKTLNGIKKIFAPAWVQHLYARVPSGMGLGRIQFFSVTQNPEQLGTHRVHPLSELMEEDYFQLVSAPGKFEYTYPLKTPIQAVGLWISIDGDDTASKYELLIKNLSLDIE